MRRTSRKDAGQAQQKKALSLPGSTEYLYAGETPSTHGRQPGTLASLAINREKKTREVLAELGIKPEDAAVTLRGAQEALLRVMPDSKAKAMSPADLFQAAVIPSRTSGNRALRDLLSAGKHQRIGEPRKRPFLQVLCTEGLKRVTREVGVLCGVGVEASPRGSVQLIPPAGEVG